MKAFAPSRMAAAISFIVLVAVNMLESKYRQPRRAVKETLSEEDM